jgi:ABC-type nitrate/sulfonate/bicarbonate transport system permease component
VSRVDDEQEKKTIPMWRAPGADSEPNMVRENRRHRLRRIWPPAVSIGAFLLIWEYFGLRSNPLLIPTPGAVARSLAKITTNGPLLKSVGASAQDLFTGLGLAIASGLILGVLLGQSDIADRMFSPFVNFMNATPLVALIPIIIIWLGIGFEARVFFVWMISVWAVLVNTLTGVRNVDRSYIEVAQSFGLSQWQLIRKITLPAAAPYIFAGLRLALGHALIGMLIGEMDMQLAGLGGLAINYGNDFQTSDLLAVILVTSMFGIVFVAILKLIQNLYFPWILAIARSRK